MSALQYSDVAGYAALLLRPTLSELQLAGALIELSHEWLAGSRASWSQETRTWRFPGPGRKAGAGGASLSFGYLASGDDLGRYAGHQLQLPRLRRADPLRGGPLPSDVPRPPPAERGRTGRQPTRRRPRPRPGRQQPRRPRPCLGRQPLPRLAGSEPSSANRDPDYTVGLRLELDPSSRSFYITDIGAGAGSAARARSRGV